MFGGYTDELILTSQNLVLVEKSILGRTKAIRTFPLNQIKVYNGEVQAVPGKARNGSPSLDVYFVDGMESFRFQINAKKETIFWAQKINQVVTGTAARAISPDATGSEKVAEAMKGTVDAFKGAFGIKSKAEIAAAAASVPVARGCSACGAHVSGTRGQVVTCAYCDTANQL